jgi:hypothetical protein
MAGFLPLLLLATAFVSETEAGLRVRFANCVGLKSGEHDCRHVPGQVPWRLYNAVVPGIWDGYDEHTGFDNVGEQAFGAEPESSAVVTSFWVDSLFEQINHTAIASPLVKHNITGDPDSLVHRCALYIAGGLQIPVAGTYEFKIDVTGRGFVLWLDKNHDGEIEVLSPGENLCGTLGEKGWESRASVKDTVGVTFDEAGLYKVFAFFWNWYHNDSFLEIRWKMPGDSEFRPIGSQYFGRRRQFGLPRIRFANVSVGNRIISPGEWDSIPVSECETIAAEVQCENLRGAEPVLEFDLGVRTFDPSRMETVALTTVCSTGRVTYRYASPIENATYTLRARVRREGEDMWSYPTNPYSPVRFSVLDDPGISDCGYEPNCAESNARIHPEDGRIRIASSENAFRRGDVVEVYNVHGRRLSRLKYKAENKSFSHVVPVPGVYLLRVQEQGGRTRTIRMSLPSP